MLDRDGVAAGSSWGNAGWLTPGIATPLPEPAVLKYGLRAVLSPSSPVYVPPSANPDFLKFVTGFTRHSTMKAWKKAMGALVPVNDLAARELRPAARPAACSADTVEAKSFLAAYRTERRAHDPARGDRAHPRRRPGHRVRRAHRRRGPRRSSPSLSDEIGAAIRLRGQRFINPGAYVHALADSVTRPRRQDPQRRRPWSDIVDAGARRRRRHRRGRPRSLRRRRAGDRRLARQAGPPVRRAHGRPGRPRLQLQRRRSSTSPTARSTSRPSAWPARRSATGCASPG